MYQTDPRLVHDPLSHIPSLHNPNWTLTGPVRLPALARPGPQNNESAVCLRRSRVNLLIGNANAQRVGESMPRKVDPSFESCWSEERVASVYFLASKKLRQPQSREIKTGHVREG